MEKPGYVNVDEVVARTTIEEAASLCGVQLDVKQSGKEARIDCPFGCQGDHRGRKEIAVNIENPNRVFLCHSYSCGFRGTLLTLMHGWLTGTKPSGGKLRGSEFRRIARLLARQDAPATVRQSHECGPTNSPAAEIPRNIPLADSPNPKARELATLADKLIVDVENMSPAAASYVRRHPCLMPETMRKWGCGYMPMDGGGDKRGYSLRGQIIYPVLSEDGKVLAWIGRDPLYEEKERAFARLTPEERGRDDAPAKHHFPKNFHRGIEVYGQQGMRLDEPGFREKISSWGIILTEGMNDAIALDSIGVPAVAIMSNRMTESQGEKIVRWARQLARGRVTVMFDCQESGIEGAKEALWFFAQRQLDVRLAWSPAMYGGRFAGRQPESLTRAEWDEAIAPAITR
jgi:hypothetical protein